jgi:putative transposase
MDETLREQIALFRYGVIAELIHGSLQAGEKEQRVGAIVARTWEMPGSARVHIGRSTVRDWIELYKSHGFDGLKPVQRVDAGRSRAIPEPVPLAVSP